MNRLFRPAFFLFLSTLLLASCGGGGGDTEPDPDTTAPVITLNGASTVTLIQGDSYVEAGASATDDRDGTVSVIITGSVDTSTLGSYTITYSASDTANNTSTASRTVDVELGPDTTPPVIALNGASTVTLIQGDSYVEAGASATDDRDGTVSVSISGTVDTNTVGNYTITYSASDAANNTSTASRTVDVLTPDTTPPVIALNGASTVTLIQGDSYVEAGASATDDRDGTVSVTITGSVDTGTVGSYTITYSASDAANNTSTATRTVNVSAPRSFITTWKTDNPGSTLDNQIKIGTSGSGYNYNVDWGDGQADNNVTGDITHTYASAGTYTVSISGEFPQIYFASAGYDNQKLLSIEQWGDIQWQSMNSAFYDCVNLQGNATDAPDLSQVTDMSSMFRGASAFNQDISSWDVASVTDMGVMFYSASAFNQDISSWNVASVTDMAFMFRQASAFNQDLNSWNVASVTNMSWMFYSAGAFNQDLSSWDVAAVTDMSYMFSGASTFNQNLSSWNVSSVTNMSNMFSGASTFNQVLSSWNVSSVTNMNGMFSNASAFNQDLSNWEVASVTDMRYMFSGASTFNQNLSSWDVASVTSMRFMFYNASAFNQDLSLWDVSAVTDMTGMFTNVTLSTANYDALLSGWSSQSLQSGVTFNAGSSQYSSISQGARDVLTGTFSWTVTDGGVAP